MGLFSSLFDDNARDIKKYNKILQTVNSFEPAMQQRSDAELSALTAEFRRKIANGATEQELLPEAFATVREASRRILGMRHFDVQMIGGMTLSDGRIAEMRTGEGKTLVATAPAYLHALSGKGVHVITVNDYLAQRDSEWMGRVYKFLGLSVGLVIHSVAAEKSNRKEQYACDITYGTNNEFGFDYLRDNMCFSVDRMVQRPLHYAIVDEVDSILIDEARTPLIISGPSGKPTELYSVANRIPPLLHEKKEEDETGDYTIDRKTKQVALTEEGVAKVEHQLGIDNLYDPKNTELSHHVNQALKAHYIFKRDRDYVVKDGQVIIVDEFTGRLMFGRRYNEGLHQAIEAKEHVNIQRESQTLGTITFQNFFRMYDLLAGMTGTAKTEENEFQKIYGLDVVEIPTNKPSQRKDLPDIIYRSQQGKFNAVVDEIAGQHETGRPLLVGTISIERSELISRMLKQRGIPHNVLNAKFHEQEAHIISQAGRKGAVTIATNMAGRGTDILLGGNAEMLAADELDPQAEHRSGPGAPDNVDTETWEATLSKYRQQTAAEHDEVVRLGGLHIIGTERHESRRIDNQLRGRAGRQGDPGETQFFLSMEDDLMLRFGGGNLGLIMDKLGADDSIPIAANLVSSSIEKAQKRVEERHFDARKTVLDYDDVMNQQRELIYGERRKALTENDIHDSVVGMMDASVNLIVDHYSAVSQYPEEWDLPALLQEMSGFIPAVLPTEDELKKLSKDEVYDLFRKRVADCYAQREQELGKEALNTLEHVITLKVVDAKWMDHLDAMDQMRQGIGLRAIGHLDPLVEYKKEAYDMFQSMIEDIQMEVSRLCLQAQLIERPQERTGLTSNHGDTKPAKKQPVRKTAEDKIGRNDPCPCGSGKKYKNCCGKNQ